MKDNTRLHIVFLTRSLERGGAETQLTLLAQALHAKGHKVSVAVFYRGGSLEAVLKEAQIPVTCLNKRGRWDVFQFLLGFILFLHKCQPQILHSYIGTPNLLACFAKLIHPAVIVVWGLRSSNVDINHYDRLPAFLGRIEAHLSGLPDLILANSYAGKSAAIESGFPPEKIRVIQNGIDSDRFRPDVAARTKLRKQWGISESEKLIGLIGRVDPQKGHATFLRAAAILAPETRDIHFVCVGRDAGPYQDNKDKLRTMCNELDLQDRVIWAGEQTDMRAVYSALDILCSCSFGEGFANVIAEAMACGTPCVVTDVGDSAMIVGNLGAVVPPRNHLALANAIRNCLGKDTGSLAMAVRERIVTHYSITNLANKTELELMKRVK